MNTILKLIWDVLIPRCLTLPATGDPWLEARFAADAAYIGHPQPYYKLFWEIAAVYKPAFSVELGSYWGTAAAHLAGGNPAGRVITVDIHREDKRAQAYAQEADAHYPNLTYVNAWTWDAVPVVAAWGKPIDLLFIDAWHEYEYAHREWELYGPMLNPEGALVICDDIMDDPAATIGMVRFWEEIPGEKIITPAVHPGIPMGFVWVVGIR